MKQVVTFVETKNTVKMKTFFLASFLLLFVGSLEISAQNQHNDNEQIKELIAKKRAYNERYGYGFRIQLYNGNEKRAKNIRARFRYLFPNVYTKLKYDAPEWKIQVGNYKTRLEADKAVMIFSQKFSGIIVIPMGK